MNKTLYIILALLFMSFGNIGYSQQTIYEGTTLLYRKEINGGLHLHGQGFGVFFTKSKQKTATKHNRWNIEIATMKHPKEEKRFQATSDNSKGFFFGKKNALILVRPTFGRKTIISEKYRKDGVSISTHFAIGPAIGLLKPVYIEYGYRDDQSSVSGPFDYIAVERFDIEKHSNVMNIYGRASFFEGLFETTTVIGLHTKLGFDFEYSPYQTGIKGIETGIAIDAFPQPVEIMDLIDLKNKSIFFSLYLNLYFGKKYNVLN